MRQQRIPLNFSLEDIETAKEIRRQNRLYPLLFWSGVLCLPVINPPKPRSFCHFTSTHYQIKIINKPAVIKAFDTWRRTNKISRSRAILWLNEQLPELPDLPDGWEDGPIAATKGYNQRIGYIPPSGVGLAPEYLSFYRSAWACHHDNFSR